MDLLHQKHILLVPGSGFDWPDPDHCRIIMLPEADALSKAIDDIADFLSTYKQKIGAVHLTLLTSILIFFNIKCAEDMVSSAHFD